MQRAYSDLHAAFKEQIHEAIHQNHSPAIPWPELTVDNKSKSIAYYNQVLPIIIKLYGNNHHVVARHYYLLGQSYAVNDDIENAIKYYRKSLAIVKNYSSLIRDNIVLAKHQSNITIIHNNINKLKL